MTALTGDAGTIPDAKPAAAAIPDQKSRSLRRWNRFLTFAHFGCQGTPGLPPGRTADLHLRGHVISTLTDSGSPVEATIWSQRGAHVAGGQLPGVSRRAVDGGAQQALGRSPWTRLGFAHVPGASVPLDGVDYYVHFLDFGPASVDGWLTRIIATELQIDEDTTLDVAQHQLVLAGRRVALTKLEFEVFKYLYERPGQVVERASLLRDVWGYDYAGGSNVIEALIRALRRKLGERAIAIETVRGLGYRFVPPASRFGRTPASAPHGDDIDVADRLARLVTRRSATASSDAAGA